MIEEYAAQQRWIEWENKGGVERVTATLKAVHKNSSWWKRRKPLKEEHIEKYMRFVCRLNDGFRQPLESLVEGYRLKDFEYDKLYKDFKKFSKRKDKYDAKQDKYFELEREREFKEYREQMKEIEKAEKAAKRAEKSSFMDKLKGWFKKKEKIDKSVLGNKAQETEDRKKDGGVSSKPTISKEQVLALQGRVDPTPKEPVKATKIDINTLRRGVDMEPR